MAFLKCKMCGGDLNITTGSSVAICEYCGSKQTLPKLDDEKRVQLFDRANHFRRANEFDKAMGVYEMILSDAKDDAEAYWGIVLCRYGITYVEDPKTGKRMPTVNRAQFTSIFDDSDYKSAIGYCSDEQKALYEAEAKAIDNIHKTFMRISKDEEPFDVFICYKETDDNGDRTQDSVYAYDIYDALTKEGFKVFFARVTLEDKLGSMYEPYIFSALNSAKVMLAIGTKREYFDAVWVKNEWSRFLGLIKDGKNKTLIPVYKDMSPYDMPEEFTYLQSQDMGKIGYIQDIVRGVKKIVDDKNAEKPIAVAPSNRVNVEALLKRAFIFLEDEKWDDANEYIENVLDEEPENARAYLAMLMFELRVSKQEALADCAEPFDDMPTYEKAYRYADDALKKVLQGYIDAINERIMLEKSEKEYQLAKFLEQKEHFDLLDRYSNLKKAKAKYSELPGYKDADERAAALHELIKETEVEMAKQKAKKEKLFTICVVASVVCLSVAMLLFCVIIPGNKYKRADEFAAQGDYLSAIALFEELGDYKDAQDKVVASKYNYANDLLEEKNYKDAYFTFAEVRHYESGNTKRIESGYYYAKQLMDNGDFVSAKMVFTGIGSYKDSDELKDKCLAEGAKQYFDEKNYGYAISWYKASSAFDENNEFYREACYNYALSMLDTGKFVGAIGWFERSNGYGDAENKINNTKYRYIQSNKNREDKVTYKYLCDLKEISYENCAEIYDELYAWKVEVFAINTSPDDEQTNMSSISVYDPVYFHFKVTGGYPGEKVTVTNNTTHPNGATGSYQSREYYDGYVSYWGWETGIYNNPAYGTRGFLTMYFYVDGVEIGRGSVQMTS